MKYRIVFENKIFTEMPQLVKNDDGHEVYVNLLEEDDTVYVLAGTETIIFYAIKLNQFDEELFNINGNIENASDGQVEANLTNTELSEAGSFKFYCNISDTNFSKTIFLGFLNIINK